LPILFDANFLHILLIFLIILVYILLELWWYLFFTYYFWVLCSTIIIDWLSNFPFNLDFNMIFWVIILCFWVIKSVNFFFSVISSYFKSVSSWYLQIMHFLSSFLSQLFQTPFVILILFVYYCLIMISVYPWLFAYFRSLRLYILYLPEVNKFIFYIFNPFYLKLFIIGAWLISIFISKYEVTCYYCNLISRSFAIFGSRNSTLSPFISISSFFSQLLPLNA
jgi:hypothetical protein